jgi:hypothetical protein
MTFGTTVRAMMHYELFPSSAGHTDSMIDMMNNLHDDDEAQNDKFCRDTDYSDEMDLYVNDFMMSMHHDLVLPVAPKSEKEALSEDNPDRDMWIEAIQKEVEQFDAYNIFQKADPVGHAMKTKFVFTVTFKSDYTLKYKARLVVCGYSQIKGIDYHETYAPTVQTNTVFLPVLLFLAGWGSHRVSVFDVTAAFLEGEADCVQYCRLPNCLDNLRMQIIGNMYGEKQAPKVWNDKFNAILNEMGLERCPWDPCLYFGEFTDSDGNTQWIILAVHVDDGYIVASDDDIIKEFHTTVLTFIRNATLFSPNADNKIKYIGMDVQSVKCMDLKRVEETDEECECTKMALSQTTYIEDMKLFELSHKIPKIPMNNTVNLRVEEGTPEHSSLLRVTGKLRDVCERGEISTGAVPSEEHYKVARQAYNYLKSTSDKCLKLGGAGEMFHFAFCDAS